MIELHNSLTQSLQTGFIDQLYQSNKEYIPEFLVNDKKEGKKVLTTILSELENCEEFWFSVAFVTTGGISSLINQLIKLDRKGVKGKILVSQYLNFTQPEALKRLLQFKNIKLKIVVKGAFHSKGYLFKTGGLYNLIIGSSNLTASALSKNKEWNLKISATPESDIINKAITEFTSEFKNAITVTPDYIDAYQELYQRQFAYNQLLEDKREFIEKIEIKPNSMQVEALANLKKLRLEGENKALLISATGTGKTYLSAFDAKSFNPSKFLFVVHRENIAKAAMETFQAVFGDTKTFGMYTGNKKELDKDFIFSTVQTISKEEYLQKFDPTHFDYIVIDESHHAGADSYQRILNYFNPKFILGMTATPERTDGLDIFQLFDHNIAYEIRLHRAMEEEMLSPFHYFGVTDITVDGVLLDETADFKLLTSNERIKQIVEKINVYGCDDGSVRGLIFCSRTEECKELSKGFNKLGYKTIALTGESSDSDRTMAITNLESNNLDIKLDYIFTVDIFNEGVNIPRVNQVIMLRPTQSAIIFVQQMGRGLRKADYKEYLTIIDFIGNYSNNYLVPIALYGDTSYNKDSLRQLLTSGSSLMPGTSTINFDEISLNRIYESIDSASMMLKKDLVNDYNLLKFKLGRIPMMIDFIKHGSRDPQLYVNYSKSYFNFVQSQEDTLKGVITVIELKLLELFSKEINNSKRVEESLILRELICKGKISRNSIKKIIFEEYGYHVSEATIDSCIGNLNFEFITEKENKKMLSVREIYNTDIVKYNGDTLFIEPSFTVKLENVTFRNYLLDNIEYSINTFNRLFELSKFDNGFVFYRKYSRKDVFRILNWARNPVGLNVGGYMLSQDDLNCAIFVNYHKEESISETTKYEDHFVNNNEFGWMTKSNRNLKSREVQLINSYNKKLRLPLFIKKNNDEGDEFYYMGDITPIEKSIKVDTLLSENKKYVSVVKINFTMNQPVENGIFNYITKNN